MSCPYYAHNCTCLAEKLVSNKLYIPTIIEENEFCTKENYKSCPHLLNIGNLKKQRNHRNTTPGKKQSTDS